jgi:hypothetical protein
MIHKARVLLSLFWFAVQPIADLADAPIVALDRLRDQLLGYQPQLALFGDWIDSRHGYTNGVSEQLLAGISAARITTLSGLEFHDLLAGRNLQSLIAGADTVQQPSPWHRGA